MYIYVYPSISVTYEDESRDMSAQELKNLTTDHIEYSVDYHPTFFEVNPQNPLSKDSDSDFESLDLSVSKDEIAQSIIDEVQAENPVSNNLHVSSQDVKQEPDSQNVKQEPDSQNVMLKPDSQDVKLEPDSQDVKLEPNSQAFSQSKGVESTPKTETAAFIKRESSCKSEMKNSLFQGDFSQGLSPPNTSTQLSLKKESTQECFSLPDTSSQAEHINDSLPISFSPPETSTQVESSQCPTTQQDSSNDIPTSSVPAEARPSSPTSVPAKSSTTPENLEVYEFIVLSGDDEDEISEINPKKNDEKPKTKENVSHHKNDKASKSSKTNSVKEIEVSMVNEADAFFKALQVCIYIYICTSIIFFLYLYLSNFL